MNYEAFYDALQPLEKDLKDAVAGVNRYQKAIVKNTETGNITELQKALTAIRETAERLTESIGVVADEVENFNVQQYFVSGDFSKQLLESCEEKHIDVNGEKGVYEMFPYKVRVTADEEHAGEVYMNRKKIPSCRPSFVAETVRQGQEKLYKAKFNEGSFMNELAEAYETTVLKSNARIGSTQSLTKVYKTMVPMARARREYDQMAFAFDLARLYELGTEHWVTKDGKRYAFGTSRDGKTGIRVLSSTGVESYISTIRMLNEGE